MSIYFQNPTVRLAKARAFPNQDANLRCTVHVLWRTCTVHQYDNTDKRDRIPLNNAGTKKIAERKLTKTCDTQILYKPHNRLQRNKQQYITQCRKKNTGFNANHYKNVVFVHQKLNIRSLRSPFILIFMRGRYWNSSDHKKRSKLYTMQYNIKRTSSEPGFEQKDLVSILRYWEWGILPKHEKITVHLQCSTEQM